MRVGVPLGRLRVAPKIPGGYPRQSLAPSSILKAKLDADNDGEDGEDGREGSGAEGWNDMMIENEDDGSGMDID